MFSPRKAIRLFALIALTIAAATAANAAIKPNLGVFEPNTAAAQPVFFTTGPDAPTASATLVISQFQVAGDGVNPAADEFVELHNISQNSIDLNGYSVVYRSAAGTTDVVLFTFSSSTILSPGQFYLLAQSNYNNTQWPGNVQFAAGGIGGAFAAAGGGLGLRNAGALVDSVGYGTATNAFVEGTVIAAPAANAGNIRKANGCTETDNNSSDFQLQNPSTPRNTVFRIGCGPAPTITSVTPNSGPASGGTTVVISGSGFINVTALSFDTTQTFSYTVDSTTQITATSPAHTGGGTFNLTVNTVNGTATGSFTYTVPTPTITLGASSLPDFGSIEVGQMSSVQQVSITGSGLTGPINCNSAPQFDISNDNSTWTGSGNFNITYAPDPSGNVNGTLFVRFHPYDVGVKNSTNFCSATGATTQTLTVSGTATTPVHTLAATNVTTTTATLNGNITSDGGRGIPFTSRGFYYKLGTGVTAANGTNVPAGSGLGAMNANISGLTPGQLYSYVAYGTSSMGTTFSTPETTFTTVGRKISGLVTVNGSIVDGVTVNLSGTSSATTTTAQEHTLTVNPGGATYANGYANFGPQAFDLTADMVVATPVNACSALTNFVAGKIVVVDRGSCTNGVKALNVQNAGGIGMISVDTTTPPSNLSGGTGAITIPVLSVGPNDGNTIKSQIATGQTTARMFRAATNYSFTGLADGGTFTVAPQESGTSFSPASRTFSNLTSDQTADFTGTRLALVIGDVTMAEGNSSSSTFTFTVSLNAPAGAGGVTFDIATADGTAAAPVDYSSASLTSQTIPQGQSSYQFQVLVNGDTAVEPDETFFVNVTNVTGAAVADGQGLGTITNDDFVPVTPTASNGGPYCEGATIQLSTPTVSGATYSWTGPNGFTSSQQNPARVNGTVADAGTYSVTVTVNGVTSAPGTTNVVVNGTPATPTASNDGPYIVGATILLSTPTVSGATYAWTGPNGFTSAQQNASRTNAMLADAGMYAVTVTTNGCTSAAGTTNVVVRAPAITLDTSALSFGAVAVGTSSTGLTKSISGVDLAADIACAASAGYEVSSDGTTWGSSATFTQSGGTASGTLRTRFSPTAAGATPGTVSCSSTAATTQIFNVTGTGEEPPSFSIDDVNVMEGDSGTPVAVFTLTKTGAGTLPSTVHFATQDGTATVADNDYVAKSVDVSFTAAETSIQVSVTVNGDATIETDETFGVILTSVSNASITDGSAVGTIQSDDSSIQFGSANYMEDESRIAQIPVIRAGITSGTTTATVTSSAIGFGNHATPGGTCGSGGADYVPVSTIITFDPGVQQVDVPVTICSDQQEENPETVDLTLSNPTNAILGTPSTTRLLINDAAGQFRNATAISFAGGAATSTITVSGAPTVNGGMRVTLFGVTHASPGNIDVLLVGPQGQKMVIMGDAGGSASITTTTITFQDSVPRILPQSMLILPGKYEPTTWVAGQPDFAAPAPAGPYAEPGSTVGGTPSFASVFGTSNPNGQWQLFVRDDGSPTFGPLTNQIAGGWGLQFNVPTAAGVSISGRVATIEGRGVTNARVIVTSNSLAQPIIAVTGRNGQYTVEGLQAGETYVVTVRARRFTFAEPSRVIALTDNLSGVDFTAGLRE